MAGVQRRWRPDGRELYFVGVDGKLMAAPVEPDKGVFRRGMPMALFQSGLRPGRVRERRLEGWSLPDASHVAGAGHQDADAAAQLEAASALI